MLTRTRKHPYRKIRAVRIDRSAKPETDCARHCSQQVDPSARAIHDLGVSHKGLEPRNMLWNQDETYTIRHILKAR